VDQWPGQAPSFLLVHGLASNSQLWWSCADRLSRLGHAVASIDQRGHGRSDKPSHGYTLDQACADIVALLAVLEDEGLPPRPVLAGQSWGANVALELGFRHPERFGAIVCVDGGTIELGGRFPSWEACAEAMAPPRTTGRAWSDIDAFMRRAHADWPDSAIEAQLANFERRADGTVAPWLSYDNHMELLRALWEHRPSTRYAGMQIPVLLVPADNGRSDFVRNKRASVDAAVAAMPRARAEWFSPADHDLHAQFPDRLAQLLHDEATTGLLARSAP
jgi:pimeloyl-ACP methyl ester carboxylesterase